MKRLAGLFLRGWRPQFAPTESFYESFVDFVDDRWNSRGIVTTERYATKYKEVPAHLHDEVRTLAQDLGLTSPSAPHHDHYDAVIAPGSQLWPMVMRVGYMNELRNLGVSSDRYVGLGSGRPLYSGELDALSQLTLSGTDEYSLMVTIIEKIFSRIATLGDRDLQQSNAASSINFPATFHDTATTCLISVVNTENVNGKRPTTMDTFESWLKCVGDLTSLRRVLVITQPLYLYQQGAVAIEVLGLNNGLDVEVVGASDREYLPGFESPRPPTAQILQEVNGSVKRLVALRRRLVNDGPFGAGS